MHCQTCLVTAREIGHQRHQIEINSVRVRVGRNLKAFPLPGAMTKEDRCSMENFMLKAFENLISNPDYGGKYCSFTPGHANEVSQEEYQALVDAHIAFKDMSADSYLLSAGIAADWPPRCAESSVESSQRRGVARRSHVSARYGRKLSSISQSASSGDKQLHNCS